MSACAGEAVAKIYEVKERPSFDPLIVHLPHKHFLPKVVDIPEDMEGPEPLVHALDLNGDLVRHLHVAAVNGPFNCSIRHSSVSLAALGQKLSLQPLRIL